MLDTLANIASIISMLVSVLTLVLVANMSSSVRGDSSKASNQSFRARDVSKSRVRQTSNDEHEEGL